MTKGASTALLFVARTGSRAHESWFSALRTKACLLAKGGSPRARAGRIESGARAHSACDERPLRTECYETSNDNDSFALSNLRTAPRAAPNAADSARSATAHHLLRHDADGNRGARRVMALITRPSRQPCRRSPRGAAPKVNRRWRFPEAFVQARTLIRPGCRSRSAERTSSAR